MFKGAAREDDSEGYALRLDPAARSLDLELRDYALQHEAEIFRVLSSSDDAAQRAIAAEALGYASQSKKQLRDLVRAARDPDDDVRNNATRALGVLAGSSPVIARRIPTDSFIAMLNSGIWSDRNKASGLLMAVTQTRNAKTLAKLRKDALDSLIEMARWRSHGLAARFLLGRIANLPEEKIYELESHGEVEQIIAVLTPR